MQIVIDSTGIVAHIHAVNLASHRPRMKHLDWNQVLSDRPDEAVSAVEDAVEDEPTEGAGDALHELLPGHVEEVLLPERLDHPRPQRVRLFARLQGDAAAWKIEKKYFSVVLSGEKIV